MARNASPVILVASAGKKFCRNVSAAFFYGLQDAVARLIKLRPREKLRKQEFWAVHDISFSVSRGECLAIIGPNGAGKSTLLKLINRELRADAGSVRALAPVKSMIRIGSGLQPLLSGRENIYIQCAQRGFSKRETDKYVKEIIAFAELDDAIDAPVKTYSDGMYARLDFSIATATPLDILLVDEVLAVGDIAFQMRCLDRLNHLKAQGAAIIFVSHSEMNVRHVADRCLLLFNGRQLALGDTDALFAGYYAAIGYLNRPLRAAGALLAPSQDSSDGVDIKSVSLLNHAKPSVAFVWGEPLEMVIVYQVDAPVANVGLRVQFRNSAGILVASVDSAMNRFTWSVSECANLNSITMKIPRIFLGFGLYRVSIQLFTGQRLLASKADVLEIQVGQGAETDYCGLVALEAEFECL